jgi:hypothetical protein
MRSQEPGADVVAPGPLATLSPVPEEEGEAEQPEACEDIPLPGYRRLGPVPRAATGPPLPGRRTSGRRLRRRRRRRRRGRGCGGGGRSPARCSRAPTPLAAGAPPKRWIRRAAASAGAALPSVPPPPDEVPPPLPGNWDVPPDVAGGEAVGRRRNRSWRCQS